MRGPGFGGVLLLFTRLPRQSTVTSGCRSSRSVVCASRPGWGLPTKVSVEETASRTSPLLQGQVKFCVKAK